MKSIVASVSYYPFKRFFLFLRKIAFNFFLKKAVGLAPPFFR